MSRQCTLALALLAVCGVAAQGAEETIKVEVYCASEHVPDGLKAGARVDLMQVVGKSVTASGKVSYSTTGVAQDIEVASVNAVEKPKSLEQAVKVELQVTKAQAAASSVTRLGSDSPRRMLPAWRMLATRFAKSCFLAFHIPFIAASPLPCYSERKSRPSSPVHYLGESTVTTLSVPDPKLDRALRPCIQTLRHMAAYQLEPALDRLIQDLGERKEFLGPGEHDELLALVAFTQKRTLEKLEAQLALERLHELFPEMVDAA